MLKERIKKDKIYRKNDKMSNVNSTLTIIMLNATGLNTPIKRWTLAGWIKKNEQTICCLQETCFRFEDANGFKVKKSGKTYTMKTETKRELGYYTNIG